MNIHNPEKRLESFWGKVDQKHIDTIATFLYGKNVLDMGCGHGTTTSIITQLGYNCIGMDYDAPTIEKAKKKFPTCNFQVANAEELPFETNYFDVIILRDALHHFYGEANFEKVKQEISRVAKPNSRIIFFDPNVNLMLKTMRKLSAHKDEECDFETAKEIMQKSDYKIIYEKFNTLYSLPLSGGYVGINFVPNIKFIWASILASETFFEKIVNGIGLGRHLCWRYMIVGEK
jgi:SAM-dependent methyltransferase